MGKIILASVALIRAHSFADALSDLLREQGHSYDTLYNYLLDQGYCLAKTSLYRYFNPSPSTNRLPDPEFLKHFACFLKLSEDEYEALVTLRSIKRQMRRAG